MSIDAATAAASNDGSQISSNPYDTIPATAVLMMLSITTTVGFSRVFDGWNFLGPMLTVVIVVHVTALAFRLVKLPGYLAIPLEVVVLFGLVAWKYYPDTLSGPIPTRETWDTLSVDLQLAREQFADAFAPVAAIGGFVVAAALATGLAAVLADAFAFRAFGRAEAVVPTAVLFIFAAALGIDNHRVTVTAVWLAMALTVVAVLRASHAQAEFTWIGQRSRVLLSVAPLAGVLAGCAAFGGALLGPRLPGAGDEGLVDTSSRREQIRVDSPLVDIRSRLINLQNIEMFSVAAETPQYWRVTGLPLFNGSAWRVLESSLNSVSGTFADPPEQGTITTQELRIAGLEGVLVPAAFSAISIEGGNDIGWVDATSTLVASDGFERGDEFRITSALPDLSPAILSQALSANPPDSSTLSLPDGFPQSARDAALQVTAGVPSVYEKMIALQTWFRTEFTYDLAVQEGHGNNAIDNFLRVRRGYCEQFAGTFAAMARSVGVPARVAVGFTSGELKEDNRYHVYGVNAHAWPEVWFDGIGWVSFEPTPGRGEPGAEEYTGNQPQQAERQQDTGGEAATDATTPESPTTTTVPEQSAPSSTSLVPDETLPAPLPNVAAGSSDDSGTSSSLLVVVGLVVAIVAWLTMMPRVVARVRGRSRSQRPADIIANSWLRAARTLGILGLGPKTGETPLEHANRVHRVAGTGGRALTDLAAVATAAMYGEIGDDLTALRSMSLAELVVRSVEQQFTPIQHLLAWVDPRRVRLMTL